MVYVSAGEFWMGSMDEDLDAIPAMCPTCKREWYTNETPQHRVPVDAFWIDRTEVTNAQYRRCVDAGICSPPQEVGSSSRDSYYGNSEFDHYPVVNVLAQQAQEYAQWVGGRLPTEAEWEYACRGSGAYTYPWGSSPPDKSLLNFEHNLGDTVAVGSYPDGESWIGVLDMSGNVWERTQSLLRDYPYDPDDGRENLSTNSSGVLRGGSFNDNSVTVRCMFRGTRSTVNYLLDSTGFRVCVPSQ
jgi:formylglycine-generating enzyme required for sulfatase activity